MQNSNLSRDQRLTGESYNFMISQSPRALGKRLRLLREAVGLDQGSMAKIVDVHRTAWNKYESGRILINPFCVLQLSAHFKISFEYVYAGNLIGTNPELARRLARLDPQLLLTTAYVLRERGLHDLPKVHKA